MKYKMTCGECKHYKAENHYFGSCPFYEMGTYADNPFWYYMCEHWERKEKNE